MERIPRIISTQKAAAAGDGVNTRSRAITRRMDFSSSSCGAVNIGSAAAAEEERGGEANGFLAAGEIETACANWKEGGERIGGVSDGRR